MAKIDAFPATETRTLASSPGLGDSQRWESAVVYVATAEAFVRDSETTRWVAVLWFHQVV